MRSVYSCTEELIGDTPLVKLPRIGTRKDLTVYAKLEWYNLGGSAKDRSAQGMLNGLIRDRNGDKNVAIVESSSGNLGVALARQCHLLGISFHCVVDSRINKPTLKTLLAFGAHVHMIEKPDPETGDLLTARRKMVRQLVDEIPNAVTLDQYSNLDNPMAHELGTMKEIATALDGKIDYLFVGVSTTGTISGCINYINKHGLHTLTVAVDALGSVLFGGTAGTRRIPGIGAGQVPALSRLITPHHVCRITEEQCVVGARKMAAKEGMLVGGSAGAVTYSYLQIEDQLPAGSQSVLVFHDSGMPYLDTVYNDTWIEDELQVPLRQLHQEVADPVATDNTFKVPAYA